ncbi:odorant receptor 23a [Drosophila busckii]|uniref:odorant receptor 23a n=1 Tax=Drosophila busckii TaxID=30019 RepID=UPI00083F3B96|nr:odorant receptor 23a [Drosophila busckii]
MTGSSSHFRINWWSWRLLGAVDLNNWSVHSYRYWAAVAFNIVITSGFPISLIMVMFSFELPLENLMNFNISVTSLATTVKFLIYVRQLQKVRKIEQIFTELDARPRNESQEQYFQRMSNELRLVTKIYKWAYAIITINSEINFMFRSQRSLPFPAWFPLDWTASLSNYSVALTYQLIAISTQIFQNFVDDLFPPLVLRLIAGHCELLIMRASSIGHDGADRQANEQQLIRCIEDQQKLYKLIELTKDIISWPLLMQFIVIAIDSGAALCALLFYVEIMQERLYYISFIFALAMQIFPVCYYGTGVEHLFERLHYAVFSSNWADQSYAYRKNALIFAERTQRTPKLLAGNLIPIALTTFVTNAKAAYSFCTLIADIRSDK